MAARANCWGLVERVVAPDALDSEVEKIIASIFTAGAQAVRAQKALMQQWEKLPTDRGIEVGIDAFARAFENDEPTRMLSAFAKRKR
jgi:enoyl-CoA hydratase